MFCSNPNCAKNRGAEGVARAAIKKNVIARHPEGTPLECYDCAMYSKTGLTRIQRKSRDRQRAQRRALAQAEELKVMTAES